MIPFAEDYPESEPGRAPIATARNRCPRAECHGELDFLSVHLTHSQYVCSSCGHGVLVSLAPELITSTNP